MKLILIPTLLILIFSGCSQKEVEPRVVIKKELICTKQYTVEKPNASIKILKTKGNIELAKAFKEAVDKGFSFYEEQVRRNNELCISKIGSAAKETNREEKKK